MRLEQQKEIEVERQAEVANESKQLRANAKAKAIELYPDAANVATPLGKAVADRIAALKDPDHPDHAILYADSAPSPSFATWRRNPVSSR